MDNCLFCNICSHKIDSMILFEDDELVAFKDIDPQAPVHILVVPKRHIESAAELTAGDGALLGKVYALVARLAAENGLEKGYRVVVNVGEEGGQSVPHLHFHLLGGRQMAWPPG